MFFPPCNLRPSAHRRGALLCTWLAVVSAAISAGCARADLPAQAPARAAVSEAEPELVLLATPSVEAEIGGMSGWDVDRKFAHLSPRVEQCVRRASSRLAVIGGSVSVKLRVDRRGAVRWAYLDDSTLGDRDAERCVLDLVRAERWPEPKSGEGLASGAFEIEPAEAPSSLPAYRGAHLAQRATRATRACRNGIDGAFRATLYVSEEGEVLSAGVAPPSESGEAASDCVVDALRALRTSRVALRDASAAKVSFRIAN